MRVLFMGTPDIAAICLRGLCEGGYDVVGAVCQPDRPKGRGYALLPPPVKVYATEKAIPVYQPDTLKGDAFSSLLAQIDPDVIAVVAYGKILPRYVIDYPKYGCINVHASLLPKYRGAAPMQRAIMAGERETGVCIMRMDEGLDTGDVILRESFPITEEDNFETVHDKTAECGKRLLAAALDGLASGTLTSEKQDDSLATYAAKITKEDCLLDFSRTADELLWQIRGLSPVPLAYTYTPDGKLLKVVSATRGTRLGDEGTVLAVSDKGQGEITVGCKGGSVSLTAVLPEGKGRMSAADAVRGRRVLAGDVLGKR